MKKSIKILDCTLRDGGYLNDWEFGINSIQSVIDNLTQSHIDYIECGFLKECNYDVNKTFFPEMRYLESIIKNNQNYTLMVNFGEFDIKNFSQCKKKNIKIRVAFKKHNQKEALDYISQLMNLGWDVFVNPMSTNTYSQKELCYLISAINKIKPLGVCIVDTLGNMYENNVIEIFEFINDILEPDIALGFHSHNSLQLSFSNTKAILKMNLHRDLIIDSCLYGMGRGAGNLCTERIAKYLNDNYKSSYELLPLLKTIDNHLKPIYNKSPWGYSTPFYIAAIHGCHPNYAGYLVRKKLSDEKIDEIISQIPFDKRTSFDKNLIESLIK